MKKRMLALLTIALSCSMMLAIGGCNSGNDGKNGDDTAETAAHIDIVSGGATDYIIVRSDMKVAASSEAKAAVLLRKAIAQATGSDIAITTDWDGKTDNSARAELLVGSTNRPLSSKAAEGLGKKEYRILFEGNKIAIAGGSETAVAYGVDYFIANYLPGYVEGGEAKTDTLSIPDALDYKAEYVFVVNAQGEADRPCLVQTKYAADDLVVADIIATDDEYAADPTGEADSTSAIQRALNAAAAAGGGTVYLPAGSYRITGTLTIPAFTALRGDWQDPDLGTEYGTILIADVKSDDSEEYGLIDIRGSAGIKGVTIYYPNQDITDVKPYPYTFYIRGQGDGYMLQSIECCTVINGYRGVACTITGQNAHEMLTVDTLKGTFLNTGAALYNSADVGTSKNIWFDNSYWANAPAAYNPPPRTALDAYTRANGTGMIVGDLEWTQFSNVRLSDYKVGVHIVKGFRIEFAGAFYDLEVKNTDIGILVDSIDTRWGMNLAYSKVEGSEYSVLNNTGGAIKITGCTLTGEMGGKSRLYFEDDDSLAAYAITDYNAKSTAPVAALYVFSGDSNGKTDISADLQEYLNTVGNQGGGVVYIPAGKYRMDAPVNVPAGVQLRGSGSLPTRDQVGNSNGTLIIAYYGKNDSDPDDGDALITLAENAGVRNLRFVYPENNPGDGKADKYNYTIRGKGDNVYAVNIAISAGWNGIDFRGCNNALIKKLISCCFNNAMRVGNSSGNVIEGCLQNATVMLRSGYIDTVWDGAGDYYTATFDQITRPGTNYVISDGSADLLYYNSFAYGVKSLFISNNDKNLRIINVGADNIGGTMMEFTGGDATVINMMRYNMDSYKNDGCSLAIYNRLSINEKKESNVKER